MPVHRLDGVLQDEVAAEVSWAATPHALEYRKLFLVGDLWVHVDLNHGPHPYQGTVPVVTWNRPEPAIYAK